MKRAPGSLSGYPADVRDIVSVCVDHGECDIQVYVFAVGYLGGIAKLIEAFHVIDLNGYCIAFVCLGDDPRQFRRSGYHSTIGFHDDVACHYAGFFGRRSFFNFGNVDTVGQYAVIQAVAYRVAEAGVISRERRYADAEARLSCKILGAGAGAFCISGLER